MLHECRNNALIARSFHRTANLAIPNILGTHNHTTRTIRRHCQNHILPVLQRVSTIRPLDVIAVTQVRRILLHRPGNIGECVIGIDTLRRRHTGVDRVGESRITASQTGTPNT